MMNKVSRRVFGAGVLAAGLVGGKAAFAQETPKRGGTLVATWGGGEPQACYVPAGGGSSPTFSSSKLFERLGNRTMDGSFVGELAEAWKPAADFKSYTIKIRKGVKFHDGKDMTVDDVVYLDRRDLEEVRRRRGPDRLRRRRGARRRHRRREVQQADAGVLLLLAALRQRELHRAQARLRRQRSRHQPGQQRADRAPGPWKFKEWVRGSHFEYVKNDAYWRKDLPYLDRLIIRYVRDPAGRAAAMEAGDIHIGVFNPVAPPDIKRLTATGKFVATPKGYEESVWSTSLECNMRNPIFAKREVRQAMFHAVDRNLIAKTVYYGYARPGTSPIFSPNKEFFTRRHLQDRLRSRRRRRRCSTRRAIRRRPTASASRLNLLAAGWFTENGKIGAIVKQGLEDVGVGINLTVPDRPTSIKRIYTDYDFDLAISNQANPSEPVPSTTQYYTSDGIKKGVPFRNASGFHTPEVDALVEKIKVETDPAKRKALVVEFQKIATRRSAQPAAGRARIDHASPAPGCRTTPTIPTSSPRAGTTYGWRLSLLPRLRGEGREGEGTSRDVSLFRS